MGIVIRQSFWSSAAAYLGVCIGYLNVVILMPKFLSPDEIGLYRTILSVAAFLAPFPLFGIRSGFVRFFPRKNNQQNATLAVSGLIVFILLFSLMAAFTFFFKSYLFFFFKDKAAIINEYLWLILALTGLMGLFGFSEAILKAKKNIIIPTLVRETLYKSFQAVGVVLVGLSIFSIHQFLHYQYLLYILLILIIGFFVLKKFSFKTTLSAESLKAAGTKEFYTYSRYALLSGIGTVAVLQVDQIMISKYIGLEANAIYTTAIFMAVVIELPRKFITQITQSLITEDFKLKRFDKIHSDYKKASINQIIIGSYIFLGVAINLPNIYSLMPNGEIYETGITVFYIIGLAKLTNMVFSINGEIIVMSEHYRVNIVLIALLGLMTVILNLFLIPRFGIEGAAYASLLTFFLFNVIKFFYIKVKFGFSPFSKLTPVTLALIAFVLLINEQFAYLEFEVLDILIRGILLSALYFAYVLIAKPSNELIGLWKELSAKLGLRR